MRWRARTWHAPTIGRDMCDDNDDSEYFSRQILFSADAALHPSTPSAHARSAIAPPPQFAWQRDATAAPLLGRRPSVTQAPSEHDAAAVFSAAREEFRENKRIGERTRVATRYEWDYSPEDTSVFRHPPSPQRSAATQARHSRARAR